MWRWDQQEPFGVNVPDENPSGLGAFEFSMRYPGQYFDKEDNLAHNYYRDYDPSIGRYVQADPIGNVLYKDVATRALGRIGYLTASNNDLFQDALYPSTISRDFLNVGQVVDAVIERLYRNEPIFNFSYSYVKARPTDSSDRLGLCIGCTQPGNLNDLRTLPPGTPYFTNLCRRIPHPLVWVPGGMGAGTNPGGGIFTPNMQGKGK